MRISDWSSDVCSSDLALVVGDWVNDKQHLRQPLLKWLTASGERRVKVDATGKAAHTIITLNKRYGDRKSVVSGKSVSVRVDLGGRRIIKNNTKAQIHVQNTKYTKNYR